MPALPSLRQLQYLVALDEQRNFTRAAAACFVTQSTLSAGLKELESALGANLVERDRQRVVVTPLGAEVVARARRLLAQAEDLVELASSAGEPMGGTLRLGVIPTIAPFLLPRVLPGLRAKILPIGSTRTVQPASSHQRTNRSSDSRSRSVSARRQTPPVSVAPIRAMISRLFQSLAPLMVRFRAMFACPELVN